MDAWTVADYCLAADCQAGEVYERACRTEFDAPGFCVIDLERNVSSEQARRFMIDLNYALDDIHRSKTSRKLALVSAGRFDQQVSTKPHRDGGPDQSLLILGYELSDVASELAMFDYSQCARHLGLTPPEMLSKHNPMFGAGQATLQPYATRLECFSNARHQIVVINNSVSPHDPAALAWQGVLHTATVHHGADHLRRVVNSMMVASVPVQAPAPLSEEDLAEFVATTLVRRRGYDKSHLDDDR